MATVHRRCADLVAGAHFGFVAYVVGGGFLAWRWPRSIVVHVAAVGWGATGLAMSVECPLTALENTLRHKAGQPALTTGFIDHYLAGVLYPVRCTRAARGLAAVAVALSWLGLVRENSRVVRRQPSTPVETCAAPTGLDSGEPRWRR